MKYVSVLLAVGCLLSSVSAQWLEMTIRLPDSLSGMSNSVALAYDSASNTIYVGGDSCVIAIDGQSDQKIGRIPASSGIYALCYYPEAN